MNVKMITIDLDGTLLKDDCTISKRNEKVIERAYNSGILIVPATGRVYNNAKKVLKNIKGIKYYVNSNGATVIDGTTGEVLFSDEIELESASIVYEECLRYDAFVEVYAGLDSYVSKGHEKLLYEYHENREYCDQLLSTVIFEDDLLNKMKEGNIRVNKLHIVCKNTEIKETLKNRFKDINYVFTVSTSNRNLEVISKDTTKAKGISRLCEYLGILPNDVLGIGDSMNDYEMLKLVGYPIAMGNAVENIKCVAEFITETNEKDGAAIILERMIDECASISKIGDVSSGL